MAVAFNPLDPAFLEDPYPVYAKLRREAPVLAHPAGAFVVSSYAGVSEVLRGAKRFSSEPMGGAVAQLSTDGDVAPLTGTVIAQDPPVHTGQRTIVNRGFTPRRVRAHEQRIEALVDELVAGFETKGACDLVAELAAPLPVIVIAELLGMDPERHEDFKRWSNAIVVGSTGGTRAPDHRQSIAAFREYVRDSIDRRRAHPGEDLVSLLIDAGAEGGVLDEGQLFGFVSLLLVAGSETTTNLIGNAMIALLDRPDALARVQNDLSLVPRLIEETLRFDPPVQQLMRRAREDTEVGGAKIPEGALVLVLIGSANRDDAFFPDADRFDLDRDTQGHLAFGFGNHFCLGAALARLEARIALEAILGRLQALRLRAPFERLGSFLIRGPKTLPAAFTPR